MNIGIIIQARTGSSRYPRKIYEDISGKNTLQRVLCGVKDTKVPHKIILAMPKYDEAEFNQRMTSGEFSTCIDRRFSTYFGDPDDLVDRYFGAAKKHCLDLVIRITADCPLVQGKIIDEMLIEYLRNRYNGYMGNNRLVSKIPYPDGTDAEIFPFWMLAETHRLTTSSHDREHATSYMYREDSVYKIYRFTNKEPNTVINMKYQDFSFDTVEDYELIKKIATAYDECDDLNRAIEEV